tara:strand:- start:160 stop:789 length:630 start_codon:yes stop_codon:yes gene_type:complete
MSKSKKGYYARFYEMENYSFTPMEQVFSPSPDARMYRDLKKDYLKARNAVLPQFQVEANERARIFSMLSNLQAKSGVDRYSYFHLICKYKKFTYIDSTSPKKFGSWDLQCHDYIFVSDFKCRFQNPQSGDWTVLTTKKYADQYEEMFTGCDPAKLALTEARLALHQSLPDICMRLPTPFPWVDPDIPEVFDDFYMENIWCDIMTYKVSS